MTKTSSPRLQGLDVLRAVAALLVIGSHLPESPAPLARPFQVVLGFLHAYGSLGVDMFFVLSGFLVSGLLFREYRDRHELHVGRFLVRRGLKIYPAFYVFIAVTVALRLAYGDHLTKSQVIHELLFVQNYGQGVWTHTWSLAVEEHFYALLALAAWISWRRSERAGQQSAFAFVPRAFWLLAIGVGLLRLWTIWFVPFSNQSHRFPTHLQIDSFMCGVALSYAFHFRRGVQEFARRRVVQLFASGIVLVVASRYVPTEVARYVVGHIMIYLGFAAIVLGGVSLTEREAGWSAALRRAVAYVGTHSYSIYLWHAAVFVAVTIGMPHLPRRVSGYSAFVAIYVVGSVVVGIAMARIVELPVLRIRDRIFPAVASGRPKVPVADGGTLSRIGSIEG